MSEKLATVARLFELQLEQARVARAAAEEAADRQREKARQIQSRIDEAHGLARDQMRGERGVSADELRRSSVYARWQLHVLAEQEQRVKHAEEKAEQALAEVTRRFQALSAIEDLRARRAEYAALEAARTEQKKLDDHALVRAGARRWPLTQLVS